MGDTVVAVVHFLKDAIIFILGVLLVLHATFGNGEIDRVIELTVGLILIGIVPIDVFIGRFLKNGK